MKHVKHIFSFYKKITRKQRMPIRRYLRNFHSLFLFCKQYPVLLFLLLANMYILYRGLFSPRVIFTLRHLQTDSPYLKFA